MMMIIMMYMIVKVVTVVDAVGDENGWWCRRISNDQFKIACIFLESCFNFYKTFSHRFR